MTSGFETSVEALLASGARLGQIQGDIQESFEPLRSEVDSLLGGGWSGQAAQGFSEGWQEWLQGFSGCLRALEEMGALLGTTAHGYGGAEDATQSGVLNTGVQM